MSARSPDHPNVGPREIGPPARPDGAEPAVGVPDAPGPRSPGRVAVDWEGVMVSPGPPDVAPRPLLFGAESQGVDVLDTEHYGPRMWRQGSWIVQYFSSFSGTVSGGTSEIQRNIIAERVLGLPRA